MGAEFEVSRRPGGVRKVRAAGPSAGRDNSRMGSWSQAQKVELVRLVREHSPCGAADWEVNPLLPLYLCRQPVSGTDSLLQSLTARESNHQAGS